MKNKDEIVINRYTIKDLKERNTISLTIPLKKKEIENIGYIKKNTQIRLRSVNNEIKDEKTYLRNAINAINILGTTGIRYTVVISISNRKLLKDSNLIADLPKNINLIINTDEYDYSLNEYLREENKLEAMCDRIAHSNLSPFEKYIAVYDIVKRYRPYKLEEKGKSDKISRSLRYVLDENNEYIVCCGFASLLKDQLNRIGIPCMSISLDVEDDKEGKYVGHARNIIRIDDDKYNIHGIYVADSTWDNHYDRDSYLNCAMTFDRKKEAKHLETLEDVDLLLDFHNPDDFKEKLAYYFKKHRSFPKITPANEEKLRKKSYKELFIKIMNMLITLDYQKYTELHDKYNDHLNINLNEVTSIRLETPLTNFLYDYAKFIIPLSNKEIKMDTILKAAAEVKKHIHFMSDSDIEKWEEKTIKENEEIAPKKFPYIYDPNIKKEAYLEERDNPHKK